MYIINNPNLSLFYINMYYVINDDSLNDISNNDK